MDPHHGGGRVVCLVASSGGFNEDGLEALHQLGLVAVHLPHLVCYPGEDGGGCLTAGTAPLVWAILHIIVIVLVRGYVFLIDVLLEPAQAFELALRPRCCSVILVERNISRMSSDGNRWWMDAIIGSICVPALAFATVSLAMLLRSRAPLAWDWRMPMVPRGLLHMPLLNVSSCSARSDVVAQALIAATSSAATLSMVGGGLVCTTKAEGDEGFAAVSRAPDIFRERSILCVSSFSSAMVSAIVKRRPRMLSFRPCLYSLRYWCRLALMSGPPHMT